MIGDIICGIILGLCILFVAFICVALCISAGRYDRITEEEWEEYLRNSIGDDIDD